MSKLQLKRINNELQDLIANPVENCSAGPEDEKDITKWVATIFGPENTI